jgi:dynein heavy chain, axonemal
MTGTLQNYARKHIIAIDKLNCNFKFIDNMTPDQVTAKPDDGCYIYGLFLEGAK